MLFASVVHVFFTTKLSGAVFETLFFFVLSLKYLKSAHLIKLCLIFFIDIFLSVSHTDTLNGPQIDSGV